MPKYKVLVIANNEDLRLAIRQRLAKEEEIALIGFAAMGPAVLTKISGYAPHVVLIAQEKDVPGTMEVAQRIYQGFPGCAVVLMTPDVDMNLVNAAMQSGIRLVLQPKDMDQLKDALIQAAAFEHSRTIESGKDPRVIAVYGGKGGSGKTTVAINLAVALAQSGRRTALVDLCLHFGDASILLNISAKDTIAELVQDKSTFTIDDIKSFSMQHSSGVSILCSPSAPQYAEYVSPAHVESILNQMRPYYDFVVVDLPCELNDCTLAALENSDDILLVAKPDISNLRAAKLALGILRTLQQEDKVLLLLNSDYKSTLTHKDFEQILEMPVSYIIPEDCKAARLSVQRGIPVVTGMPKTQMSQSILHLASRWQNKGRKSVT